MFSSTLKAALARAEGATVDERERICIPFFTLFVKDLYFLHVSSSNKYVYNTSNTIIHN